MRASQLPCRTLAVINGHEQLGEIAANARGIEDERNGIQLVCRVAQQLDGTWNIGIAHAGNERIARRSPRQSQRMTHLRRVTPQALTVPLHAVEILEPQGSFEDDRDQSVNGPRHVARAIGEHHPGLA